VELRIPSTAVNGIGDSSAVTLNGTISQLSIENASETIGSLASTGDNGSLMLLGDLVTGGNDGTTTYGGNSTGMGSLVKAGNGTLTLTGTLNHIGNTTVNSGDIVLAPGGSLRFLIGSSGDNNQINGGGGLTLNGTLHLDLTSAGNATASSWTLVDHSTLAASYGSGFAVASTVGSFSNNGNLWTIVENGVTYQFSQATGVLSVPAAGGDYTTWANDNVEGQAANLDFDGDGLGNGVEYFMGTDGAAFTANPQPVVGVITWPVAGVSGATAIVEVSNNLSGWEDAAINYSGNLDTSNPAQIQFTLPTGAGKIFARLSVTISGP
jgi:autotransporter-associated beta strand protein